MKKLISFAIASLMVATISTTAFAAEIDQDTTLPATEGTSVTYTVKPTYTVTIPASITLTEQTDKTYAGSGEITTSAVRLEIGETLDVTIASDFEMETIKGAVQKYTAKKNNEATALTNGATIAKFETSETAQSVKLNYSSPNPKYAGKYSDTVKFTIAINNNKT